MSLAYKKSSLDTLPPRETPRSRETRVKPSALEAAREHISLDTSPDVPIGLGRGAVKAALFSTEYALENKPSNQAALEEQRRRELDTERDYLASLDESKAQKLEKILRKDTPPAWLAGRIDFTDEKWGVIKQLTEKWPGGEHVIPDGVFQNFLEWHNYTLAEKQREFNERIPEFKKRFTDKINIAVKRGWAPPSLGGRLYKLNSTRIIVDDGLLTTVAGSAGTTKSAMDTSHSIVKIAPDELSNPSRVLDHELTHVLEGEQHPRVWDDEYDYRDRNDYGLYRIFGRWGGRTLNEATVEHFSHSLRTGNFQVTNPKDSRRDGAVYEKNRSLLHLLSTGGAKKIDIRQFTWALFEDSYQNQNEAETARGKLVKALHEAFPFTDVVQEIQEFTEETDITEYTKLLAARARLHRPHLVKRVGSKLGEAYGRGRSRVSRSRARGGRPVSHSV
jgi:hypothetical protein